MEIKNVDNHKFTLDLLQSSPQSRAEHKACSWRLLFSFTKKKHVRIIVVALFSAIFVAALKTMVAVFLGRIFDIVSRLGEGLRSEQSALSDVSLWCLALIVLGIGTWLTNTLFLVAWIVFGELQANEAQKRIYLSLLSKNIEWSESLSGGIEGLQTRLHTQTRELQLATSQILGFVICDIITSCASVGIALYYSWKLALVLFASLPVSLVVLGLVTRNLDAAVWSQKYFLQKASTFAASSLKGIDIVRVFTGLDKEQARYGSALKLASRHSLVQARCNSMQIGYIAFWSISIFVLGFWYGLVLVEQGLPPGNIVTAFYAILTAFQCVEAFGGHWIVLSRGKSAALFLSTIAHTNDGSDSPSEDEGSIMLETCAGDVRLDKVDFAYESNPTINVIEAATIHFRAGQFTFLVGESGCGKSTVCSLVANLLTPVAGEVTIDGHAVHQIHPSCLRRHVCVLHQNSPVLNDSFFNNVALGHSRPAEVSATEVRQACAFAQLESTILNLHNGQATIVGPDSHHLSGGQRQRLALARARLRDPAILVLDEPTSSLDPVSQITVMKAIREWRKDKTTIIVTHDASNIQETDFVYTMRNRLPILQEHMLERRNLAPTVQFPEDTAETRRTSLLLATTLSFSRKDRSSQLVEHWSATDHQQSIIQPTSSTARNSWCGSISKSRKRRARKSVIAGWRLTADQKGKQKQFSDYLDQHFDIYEPTYTLGKSQWDFISTSHRSSAKVLDMTEQDTTDFSGSNSTSNSNPVSPTSSIQTSIKSQGEFYDLQKQPIDSFRRVVHTVWPSLGSRDKVTLIIAFVLCLASATATPAFSFCLAQLLSAMWSKTDKVERGLRWALYLVGIAVADGLCTGVGHYLFDKVSQSWVDRLRQDAFKNVLEQPRSWFQKHRNSSRQFNERLDRNAQEMRVIVGKFLPISTVVATIMSISTIWALAICWKLALVTLSSLPLIVLVIRAYIIVNSKWAKKCNEAASSSSAVLQEVLLNFEFVRSFALETHFGTKQCTSANHTLRTGIKKALYTSPLFGLCQSITLPLTAMVFYYGTSLVSRGNGTSVSEVLQVINLLLFSIGTSFDLLDGLPQLTAAKVAATELLTYINLPRAGNTFDHMSVQPESPLPMRLFNVDFAPDQQSAKVLNRLSLDIIPGSSLAVVGPSGSGKSTLLSLLLGLSPLDRQSQSKKGNFEPIFTFAGVPYPAVDLTHLRSMMAYVPQRPFLFPATILDNIAYGISSTCTCSLQDTVVRAAKASGIHHFISSLPDGYNTLVGDGGQVLSGGQAQLINIARALARRPRLLILDEPTSALDANSALAVRVAIRSLIRSSRERSHDLAIIVATHSVEMMQMVAEVVILVGGVKVEQGQYHQLIANRGYLYRLVNHQKEQPADTALKNENASQSWKQTS